MRSDDDAQGRLIELSDDYTYRLNELIAEDREDLAKSLSDDYVHLVAALLSTAL